MGNPDGNDSLQKAVSQGIAAVGRRGRDRVIVQNNPVNWVDPRGLTKGGKQNIAVSPGDSIGDKITDIINNKALEESERNAMLKEIEREIEEDVCKGARKKALSGYLKYAKALAKYGAKFGLILGIATELAFPDTANALDDVTLINNYKYNRQ